MPAASGEFDIIRDFFAGAKKNSEGVVLGIGDDCALLRPPAEGVLATSVDTLVADRHFPAGADPVAVAARALRVNLSDLAAMNARPLWFTLALTLPHSDVDWLRAFSRGLLETAARYGISLVGGDTTRGPLSITIQVTGISECPLRRDGASAGDAVYVSGSLGAAAAALPVILGQQPAAESTRREAEHVFYFPEPQLSLSESIGGLASSALDISDGLLADLGHICAASGVSADIDMQALPVAPLAQQLAGEGAAALAAGGGDDYQLCFTVPPENIPQLELLGLDVTRIGRIVEGAGEVRAWRDGERWIPQACGYQHF
ncbi:thiamine-monophosphate kinase [Microbulbifer thermotolerans]|uniref:thiamine-phosphate kinase n=1 Tax=Microbulbifer thermotolerans TaxID=252514 RepID=UPI0008E32BFF|nr:thiamine-phosphate kinase [Microbulbifer thermotolerans]SFC56812.1 thiamine-monophosphate kinase [Microbulbifer thermotolerans]